ncbi:hypothetical protein SSP35_50_00040 [Streptomyces sp. NBRC 110611]|nr:hypothetical protein SSP35_50_00040 [Streptomyces sp. NBRC 110611]
MCRHAELAAIAVFATSAGVFLAPFEVYAEFMSVPYPALPRVTAPPTP